MPVRPLCFEVMLLFLPRRVSEQTVSPYARLGLRDLPFPTEPVVDPYNSDPRRNGSIYAEASARATLQRFEELLISPSDFNGRARLAYLWAKGDQQTGRGLGKTALLSYFRHRINRDWGLSEFGGRSRAVVVYVSFSTQADRRYMDQLALSALVDVCRSGVLDSSRAFLRQRQIFQPQVEAIVRQTDGSYNPANLLDDEILRARRIEPAELDDEVAKRLEAEGIGCEAAQALSRGSFEDYLRSFRRDKRLEPFYVPRDTRVLDYARGLLFNDIVLYLLASGFSGGYLFIDDIENLVDQMTRKDRMEFAQDFALCIVRPSYVNKTHNFFSSVLCTHQQASNALSNAWKESGLSAIAQLDPTSPNSVELPLPSPDQARQIIVAHLDYFRTSPGDRGKIDPFTEGGLAALLANRQHPRVLLSSAATVLVRAARDGVTSIDPPFVKMAIENSGVQAKPDFSEGNEDAG
jgi:hypothetical protein